VEWILIVVSVGVAVAGILFARALYGGSRGLAAGEAWAARFPAVHRLLVNKYWVDEIYDATFVKGTWASARNLFRFDASIIDGLFVMGSRHFTVAVSLLSGFVDKYFVDGLVNLVGWILNRFSALFRRVQTGLVSQYALILVLGVFVLVCAVFLRDLLG